MRLWPTCARCGLRALRTGRYALCTTHYAPRTAPYALRANLDAGGDAAHAACMDGGPTWHLQKLHACATV
eukprot:51301-Chlamydomonas_euryale.AAC.6